MGQLTAPGPDQEKVLQPRGHHAVPLRGDDDETVTGPQLLGNGRHAGLPVGVPLPDSLFPERKRVAGEAEKPGVFTVPFVNERPLDIAGNFLALGVGAMATADNAEFHQESFKT